MKKMKIAISGKARAGKDTVARILQTQLIDTATHLKLCDPVPNIPYVFKTAFANPIKYIIKQMYPLATDDCLWGSSELRSQIIPGSIERQGIPLSYRQLLMDIGKFGRSYDPDIWIKATLGEVDKYLHTGSSIALITDLRLQNEFRWLKRDGYFLIRVVRTTPGNQSEPEISHYSQDISEIDLDQIPISEFDYVITNDSTLSDLKDKILTIPLVILS